MDTLDAGTAASLLATAGDIALVIDRAGVIRDIAVSSTDSPLGPSDAWVGQHWTDTVTGETRTKVETLLREASSAGVSKRRQVNHPAADGYDVPVSYTAVRIGRDGNIVAVGRDMRPISALQQRLVEAQQAMERDYWRLRHVETRYRLLFQLANDGILVVDGTTLKILDANTSAANLFGIASEQVVGRTFPFGFEAASVAPIGELLASARSAGRAGDITVTLTPSHRQLHLSASCFRQEASTLLLIRMSPVDGGTAERDEMQPRVLDLVERLPDGFVVTDLEGHIQLANRAFLDLAELASEEQARGELLSDFLGRPGSDFPVFVSILRKHGAIRLVATAARGSHGHQTEVEVSAVWVPDGPNPCIGFTIRDIGRRLAAGPQGARDLSRAVEELTSLVGRVTLRDLVRDTIDLVERHFIEAALELTNDNRTSAAEVLGVSRQSLYVKMRRHRLAAPGSGDDPLVN